MHGFVNTYKIQILRNMYVTIILNSICVYNTHPMSQKISLGFAKKTKSRLSQDRVIVKVFLKTNMNNRLCTFGNKNPIQPLHQCLEPNRP